MTPTPSFEQAGRERWSLLLCVLVLAALLRVILFRGYVGLDDGEYARMAHQIAEGSYRFGEYSGPAVFPLRVGLIFPTALSFKVLGFSEWSMVLYPFLSFLGTLVLAYVCARILFGPVAGLVAAGILGLVPQDVEAATILLPDLPAALFAAAGITMIITFSGGRGAGRIPAVLVGCLAGGALGVSWLHKESVAYLAPLVAILLWTSIRREGRAILPFWIGVAVGSFGVLLGEMAVYGRVAGDFLFRFHEVERNYAQWDNGFFSEGSNLGWQVGESRASALTRRLLVTGPRVLLLNPSNLYLPSVALLGVIYGWRSRDRAFLIPALWMASLLFMFNFASSSTSSYTPLALYDRYIYPVFFPAALLIGGLVARQAPAALSALRDRRVPIGSWSAIVASGIVLMSAAWQFQYQLRHPEVLDRWTAEIRELSPSIDPQAPLYADTLSLRGLAFLDGYPEDVRWTDFERVTATDGVPPGSLVLVNPRYLDWLQLNRGMWLSALEGYRQHSFYDQPPSTWVREWTNGNASLYRVGALPPAS